MLGGQKTLGRPQGGSQGYQEIEGYHMKVMKKMKGSKYCQAYVKKVIVNPYDDMLWDAYQNAYERKDWKTLEELRVKMGLK